MSKAFPTARHSTRISIRWPPEEAYENTDTTVLSVGGWYLDLRVDVSGNHRRKPEETTKGLTPSIDWAIAGRRIIERDEPVQILFTHHLDSHNQFSTADRGTFVTLPNGDDFETGAMPRNLGESPAPYEETWRDLPPREGPENLFTSNSRANKAQAWILESLDGEDSREAGTENKDAVKTFMARIGGVFLVLQQTQSFVSTQGTLEEAKIKTGGEVSAILEEWRKENLGFEASQQKPKWIRKYSLGSHTADLPSLSTFHGSRFPGEGEDAWRQPGSVVSVLDRQYIVRAYEETGL